jgi:hypothetical protein
MTEYIDIWRSVRMAVAESGRVTGSVAVAESVPVTGSGSVHGIAGSGTGWQSDNDREWQRDNSREWQCDNDTGWQREWQCAWASLAVAQGGRVTMAE